MYSVWRAYLEGTIQVTESRISACENYKVQVTDAAKAFRQQKEQQLRKVLYLHLTAQLSVPCVSLYKQDLSLLLNELHSADSLDGFQCLLTDFKQIWMKLIVWF